MNADRPDHHGLCRARTEHLRGDSIWCFHGGIFRCSNARCSAQPYIAQWVGEHPKWTAVKWRCEYPHSNQKADKGGGPCPPAEEKKRRPSASDSLHSFRSLSDIENTASALISMSRTKHCRASAIAHRGIIASGLDPGDAQALVVIDLLVPVVQGQVRAPGVFAGGRKLETGDRRRRQVPEPDALALRHELAGRSKRKQTDDEGSIRRSCMATLPFPIGPLIALSSPNGVFSARRQMLPIRASRPARRTVCPATVRSLRTFAFQAEQS